MAPRRRAIIVTLHATSMTSRILATTLAVATVVLAWTARVETLAEAHAGRALRNALVAYASARALNGAISVAQGSELAVSPAGVGVTLTLGEILDPVNDLIERFSWVILAAAASLGAQLLLTELFAETWANVALTLIAAGFVLGLWLRPQWRWLHKVVLVALFVRFAVPLTIVLSDAVGGAIIDERQSASMEAIALANEALADETPPEVADAELGALERLGRFFDRSREVLDVERWVDELRDRAEEAIEHLIQLITLFAVQTLVLPLASLSLILFTTRQLWRGL